MKDKMQNSLMRTDTDDKWNEWFAGLLDGDGYFYISKTKEVSLEITTHITDARLLTHVKDKLGGGSLKPRSNSQSIRYRVKAKNIIQNVLLRVNGHLRNQNRLRQFREACRLFQLESLNPSALSPTSPYIAGLIDSDGTIAMNVSATTAELATVAGVEGRIQRLIYARGSHQVRLTIASVDKANIEFLVQTYKLGTIYTIPPKPKSKAKLMQYHWVIRKESDFLAMYQALRNFPLKSVKMHRIRLLPIYFKYKQLKYHLRNPDEVEFKLWEKFCRLWYKYSY
uniref:Putative LAGLIDADG homing endonuclease n=1 Tax=Hafniomonas laevis TaxID=436124 RepID=A0A0S2LNV6_9CHLO|nr:putative LAGLIDADG homing endonuclease [Hafniomonas laevis]ALO63083.1 putative LAGLIDADG homing endonuclease [Hafniomonas laevis]